MNRLSKRTNGLLFLLFIAVLSCRNKSPDISSVDLSELNNWIDISRKSPADVLKDALKEKQSLMLLQDNVLRADTVQLVKSIVPILYDEGVRDAGVFFLAAENQEMIDRYLQNEDDSLSPEKFLMNADASLGYKEYRDFILYIKRFNRNLPKGQNPLLLRGLRAGTALTLPKIFLSEESERPFFLWVPENLQDSISSQMTQEAALLRHFGPENSSRERRLVQTVTSPRSARDGTFFFRDSAPPVSSWKKGPEDSFHAVTSFPYTSVSPIPRFIGKENLDIIQNAFPDVRNAARANRKIKAAARRYKRVLEKKRQG